MTDEQEQQPDEQEEIAPLTKAQKVFVDEYLICFNGTAAYLKAYPKTKSRESARASASRLLTKVNVKAEIQNGLAEIHMSAEEALKLQADIARGDITEFFTPLGNIDFDALRQSGKGRLIKKIKQRTVTKIGKNESDGDTEILETELELYPADAAQERILKIHGKYKEEVNLNVQKPLVIEVVKTRE